jgi:hypothetical protein
MEFELKIKEALGFELL